MRDGHRPGRCRCGIAALAQPDRKSTRLNSSHGYISYAVFCLKKKNNSLVPPAPSLGGNRRALSLRINNRTRGVLVLREHIPCFERRLPPPKRRRRVLQRVVAC